MKRADDFTDFEVKLIMGAFFLTILAAFVVFPLLLFALYTIGTR